MERLTPAMLVSTQRTSTGTGAIISRSGTTSLSSNCQRSTESPLGHSTSRKKFEITTSEPFNPIKQDEDQIEGRLHSFKKGDIYFNWGCFPR
jgi:hypothetical protein